MPMAATSLSSFENPARHAAISELLRRHSTNPEDVREVALRDLDLSTVRRVLDLGCAFGYMTAAFAPRLAPKAEIIGVDALATNEPLYLNVVAATGRDGHFMTNEIDRRLDWPDEHFDLVVASYSLYFFPAVIPEVARVLHPEGLFLTITHTETSCRDLLFAAGLPDSDPRLLSGVRAFAVENADRQLKPWFRDIERIDYTNSLSFEAHEFDEFLIYLSFKLPLFEEAARKDDALPHPLADRIRAALARQNRVVLEKNDAVYRCRGPRCP